MKRTFAIAWALGIWGVVLGGSAWAQELNALLEQAVRRAAQRVAPCVVAIETVGGLERAGRVLLGTGPTTGLIVSSDGYIVSSLFNFLQKPTTILVRFHDGTRATAQWVATDHSRMIVLLKVHVQKPLPVPEVLPEDQVQVGAWAIALGRSFPEAPVSISVGIVSAKGRIWRRAIQTDAKISPLNYGGPLVDIQGRVLGVLVPLSPRGSDQVAGVQWYDSGIGFAVPMDHVYRALPRLRQGEDLRPGLLGITLKPGHRFADPAVVASVRPNSPAYKAGIQPGDQIVAIQGQQIRRQIQVQEALGPLYAGDEVTIAVLRQGKRLEFRARLTDQLRPYQRPFLGVLPQVAALGQKPSVPGVSIRYVFPHSGAAEAGLRPADRILAVEGQKVESAPQLRQRVWNMEVGQKVRLQVVRREKTLELSVRLGPQSEEVPEPQVPKALGNQPAPQGIDHQVIKLPQFAQQAHVYAPNPFRVPGAMILWLHGSGGLDSPQEQQLLAAWRRLVPQYGAVLVVPESKNPRRWSRRDDGEFLAALMEQVLAQFPVDRLRVAVVGADAGAGAMALSLVQARRQVVRAVAVRGVVPVVRVEADPVHPLYFFVVSGGDPATKRQIQAGVRRLRAAKHPVVFKQLGGPTGPWSAAELQELLRWVDTLDRI